MSNASDSTGVQFNSSAGDDPAPDAIPNIPPVDETKIYPSPVEALLAPQTLPEALQSYENATFERRPIDFYGARQTAITPKFRPRPRLISGLDIVLALIFLILPIGLGVYYFGFYAADQYVSEFRFNVIDTTSPAPVIAGGLPSVLGGAGLGSGNTDSYTVTDFLTSPQAVTEVEKKLPLRKIFSDPKADWLYRLDPKVSQEKLNWYWPWMVSSYYDPVTGIANAQVRAFSAENAYQISTTLLHSAEALVNDMQTRQRADTIRFAQDALDRDNAALAKIRQQMLNLRRESGYIEPAASGVAENTALSITLRTSIVTLQAELDSLRNSGENKNAPMVQSLSKRIAATKEQLAAVDKEISAKTGARGSGGLSATVGKFDDLNAQQAAATAMMTSDLVTLQQARAQADAQHIYLSTYVSPTKPTSSTFPNRPTGIALSILAAFGLFCFAKLVSTAIRVHAV